MYRVPSLTELANRNKKLLADSVTAVGPSSSPAEDGAQRYGGGTLHGFADGETLGDVLAAAASTLGDATSNYGIPPDTLSPLEALDAAREREQRTCVGAGVHPASWTAPSLTHARLAADVKAVFDVPVNAVDDEQALIASLATHFEKTRDALRLAQRVAVEPVRAAARARALNATLPASGAAEAKAAEDAAVAAAADAADVRARRLRAGVKTSSSSSDGGASSRGGGGGGNGAGGGAVYYLHETDVRLAAVAEGWRAAATRRGKQFAARLRWLPASPAGRRLHRAAAAITSSTGGGSSNTRTSRSSSSDATRRTTTLPLLVSTPSQLEAELERLCRAFDLDAGLTRHSLAAHVRRLFVDVFAAQEARARLTPCEGCDPSVIATRTAPTDAIAAAAAAATAPRWGSPGNPRERAFLLDPPAEAGETAPIDADAVMRATMMGVGAGGNLGDDDDDSGGGSGGRYDGRMGGSGAAVWSPEDEYWPSGIDDGGGSASASGEGIDGGVSGGDAMVAAARLDQPLQAECRALKWSDGYRAAARTAAAAAARSAALADADEDVTYAAAKAAADAAVRASDPDLSSEAAADATAEAVRPFLPSEKTGARRKVRAADDHEDFDDLDEEDAFEETMLMGHAFEDDGDGTAAGGNPVARSHASEGLATAALLRYVRTRGLRERVVHARNHAASVRARLAADRRYHESAAAPVSAAYHGAPPPPPPEVDVYEVRGAAVCTGTHTLRILLPSSNSFFLAFFLVVLFLIFPNFPWIHERRVVTKCNDTSMMMMIHNNDDDDDDDDDDGIAPLR